MPWVISVSLLALLGVLALRSRALAAALGDATKALRDARRLRDAGKAMVEAARRSSAAVLSALDRSVRDCDARVDAFLIFVPAGDELSCAYATGSRCEHYRHVRLRRDDPRAMAARAAASRCRVVSTGADTLFPGDAHAVAVPLLDADLRAVAYVSSLCGALDVEAIVETVVAAGTPYAIAIERESDRMDAMHDGLTGLLSARVFRRQLHEELARVAATAPDAIVSLWFVDTDRFKLVNDRFGHPAGDAVLQTMASLLKAHLVPGTDVAARNGGDEFCALICNATKSAAIDRARRFLLAVRGHDFGLPVTLTASVGVASYPHDASNSSSLLELADGAMYHSKRSGRNQVSFVDSGGRFASAAAEAEPQPSRSPDQWLLTRAESCMERSS